MVLIQNFELVVEGGSLYFRNRTLNLICCFVKKVFKQVLNYIHFKYYYRFRKYSTTKFENQESTAMEGKPIMF